MSAEQIPTVRFGPLERGGILLGLGGGQLAVLAVGLLVALVGVYTAGAAGLAGAAPLWLPLVVLATAQVRGRPMLAWVPVAGAWQLRARTGRTVLVAPPALSADRSLTLPGVAGSLRVWPSPTLGAALVVDRRAGTVSVVARVHGSGFVLDDAAVQAHKVGAWSQVLSTTGRVPGVVRVQVLTRTVLGGSVAARSWWARNADHASSLAARVVAELLEQATAASRRPETFVAVALRTPRGVARRLPAAAAAHLEQDIATITDALRSAELVVDGWVGVDELGAVLRTTYDPAGARDAEAALTVGDDAAPAGCSLLGALGAREHWSYLRTDSGVHATYWVVQWPRSEVHTAFLQPLIVSGTATRTVTLIAEPVPTTQALKEIRRARVEHAADATHRARVGQIEDEATRAEVSELSRREAELVAGQASLRFTGLITVTAPTVEELEEACTATHAAAAQAMCEVRRLVGQQAVAHAAAALPFARGVL